MARDFVLAIDQGTTSTRAVLLRSDLSIVATAQEEFPQHFPASGWVEHDPEDLWSTTLATARRVMDSSGCAAGDIAAIGITNQRETTLVWDKQTGAPIYRAIVWQDRRTAKLCVKLQRAGHERLFARRTGLRLDPYFSGTKVAWILDNVKGARQRARAGQLLFGTVDTYLLWRLTGGGVHATDATNASRTLMYNIHTGDWDDELLRLLNVPRTMLPRVEDCVADYGHTIPSLFGAPIPLRGIAGDQQAAAIGQACFEPGMIKATFGTGCFVLLNTGKQAVSSKTRLLTTIAYRLSGETTYALEGSIFVAGAEVQWLRDGLNIIEKAEDTAALAQSADPTQSVILVPAFVGLGAPYWDADCRGALFGLTRATTRRELARAALECVCFQMRDLVEAMRKDWRRAEGKTVLRVDGGMAASDVMLQFLADMLAAPVDRPAVMETTVLGAAYLAGFAAGLFPAPALFASAWRLDRRFEASLQSHLREARYRQWKDAVSRTLSVRPSRH
jgi:glycerol kinase